jgi:hypothetical protein
VASPEISENVLRTHIPRPDSQRLHFSRSAGNVNFKGLLRTGMVALACNPSYSGGGGRSITGPGWPRKKCEALSEN